MNQLLPKSTPWGPAQNAREFAPGIVFYSTASHGGFKLSPDRLAAMPALFREPEGWYEEDCEAAKVMVSFPEFFPAQMAPTASDTLRHYYPNLYEAHFKVTLQPGESYKKDKNQFLLDNQERYIGIAAWGSTAENNVPDGWVGVCCRRGGFSDPRNDERWVLVRQEDYQDRSEFGYLLPDTKTAKAWVDHP